MADDDPFAVFGDDGDSSSDERDETLEQHRRALIQQSNEGTKDSSPPSDSPPSDSHRYFSQNLELPECKFKYWKPPKFLASDLVKIVHLPDFGGGRAVIATKDLPAGTLVLIEEPVLKWNGSLTIETLDLSVLEQVLRARLVESMEHFHPTRDDLEQQDEGSLDTTLQVHDMMNQLRETLPSKDVQRLLDLAKSLGINNADGLMIQKDDIYRMMLALRYNALDSGLYLYSAMLNHCCSPNCVKFVPDETKSYSETRLTRSVRAGEPLTISYIPDILSHATRRHHLWEQHRFDIGATPHESLRDMELIGGKVPESSASTIDKDSVTNRVESATAELQEIFHSDVSAENAKAVEQSALLLVQEAEEQLQNPHHLLLLSILELHVEACLRVQKVATLDGEQEMALLMRLTKSNLKLRELQGRLYGRDHFSLASTNLDLAQALEELMSRSTKSLVDLDMESLRTPALCAKFIFETRNEFERIKALYPEAVL